MDWKDWRREFPVTEQLVHLNHAGVSPISRRVATAVQAFLDNALHIDRERYDGWEARTEEIRGSVARLVGATPDEIAFVKNTSEGLSLVAAGLEWREGDNVLVVENEYPSNVYPWFAQRRHGVEVRFVPTRQGRVEVEDVAARLDSRTRVVSVSYVDWNSGARTDLRPLGELCRRQGALFCVDGIQGVGAIPLDVHEAAIDCLAVGGHKWLLGPEGVGFLFVARSAIDRIASVLHGWKSVTHSEVYLPYHFDPRPDAARFEPGSPSHLGTHALGAAVELILEVGPEAIRDRLWALTDHLAARLQGLGAEILSPWQPEARSGFLVFRHGDDPEALSTTLQERGFVQAPRGGGVRIAPHFHTSEEDLDRLVETLRRL